MFGFSLIYFISHYGYLAVLVGSFFEGETILVLGGLAVQQGYLNLPTVFFCSLIGTLASDNLFFFLGRNYGPQLIAKYSFFKRVHSVSEQLSANRAPFLAFGMRFMYGFRHLIPFGLGLSRMSPRSFFAFNFLGGLSWVLSVGFAGYFFGDLLEIFFGHLRHYEFRILVIAIVFVVLGHVFYKHLRRLFERYLSR